MAKIKKMRGDQKSQNPFGVPKPCGIDAALRVTSIPRKNKSKRLRRDNFLGDKRLDLPKRLPESLWIGKANFISPGALS